MKAVSILVTEDSSSFDDRSRDPADDEAYLQVHRAAVYLATINLAVSEAASNNKWTAFLRFLFPKNVKISKHWGIVIRDTLYELARDGSATMLQVTHWPRVRDRHDEPVLIGTTTLDDEEILARGLYKLAGRLVHFLFPFFLPFSSSFFSFFVEAEGSSRY
jgi:hypothetical protein